MTFNYKNMKANLSLFKLIWQRKTMPYFMVYITFTHMIWMDFIIFLLRFVSIYTFLHFKYEENRVQKVRSNAIEVIQHRIVGTYFQTLCYKYKFNGPYFPVHGVLKARMLKRFAISFYSGPHSVRPLHHDPPILGGPTWHDLVSLS